MLATLGDSSIQTVKKWFPADTEVLQFGKVSRINGGDTMYGRDFVGHQEYERDASFVRACPLHHCIIRRLTKYPSIINILTSTRIAGI